MLQIKNVADFPVMVSSSYMGGQGRPLYIKLKPGEHKLVGQQEIGKWPLGAKENLAESMQMGHLLVNMLVAVHSPKDDGHLLPDFIACTLESAILNVAGQRWDGVSPLPPPPLIKGFVDVYNEHVLNAAVHVGPGTNVVTAATPTDLATLIVYLTAVKAAFDAHIAAAPPHATVDTANTLGAAPTDLPTSIAFIKRLYGRFNAHKKQYSAGGAFLTPDAVIQLT